MNRIGSIFAVIGLLLAGSTAAGAQSRCAPESYSIVTSPDGTAISILFDDFSLTAAAREASRSKFKTCELFVPMKLPKGSSLGLYKVDYRGFAHLAARQAASMSVTYGFSIDRRARDFRRQIVGPHDGDVFFTELVDPRALSRVGCGGESKLRVRARLDLASGGFGEAMATLDSADGAPQGAIIYHFDLRKCP